MLIYHLDSFSRFDKKTLFSYVQAAHCWTDSRDELWHLPATFCCSPRWPWTKIQIFACGAQRPSFLLEKKIMFAKFAGKNLFSLFAKPIQDPFLLENAWFIMIHGFIGSLIQSLKNGCSAGGDAALERPGHLKQLRPGHPWPRLRGRCLRAQALRPLRPSGERSASRGWLGCEEMD